MFSFRHFKALEWHAPNHHLISILSLALFFRVHIHARQRSSQHLGPLPLSPPPAPVFSLPAGLIFLPTYAWIHFSPSLPLPSHPNHCLISLSHYYRSALRKPPPHISSCPLDPSASCALFKNPSLTSLNKE